MLVGLMICREFTYMNVLKKKAEEYDRLARGEKVSGMLNHGRPQRT